MAETYFAILGVTADASREKIRSAYRRLAKEFHPDHFEGGSGPFRRIQEAYAVLGDARRRREYEKSLEKSPAPRRAAPAACPKPEPLIPEPGPVDIGAISPARSFETFTPSADEIFDWLRGNFTGLNRPKSGRIRNLTLEVPLTPEQALRGGKAAIMVPVRAVCPACRGCGGVGCYECLRCAGHGAIVTEVPVAVAFPPGLVQEHAVSIPLRRYGICNLHMTVLFRPSDTVER